MNHAIFTRLRRDENGVAAVEFGLWSTFFFLAIMVALDFGVFFIERGKVNEAVAASAVASFEQADDVNFAVLPDYVQTLAGNPAVSVTTACNGIAGSCTNLNRTCACLNHDGTYTANTCGNVCTGGNVTAGSTAGYYLTIRATQPFEAVALPQGIMSSTSTTQQATVRLQ